MPLQSILSNLPSNASYFKSTPILEILMVIGTRLRRGVTPSNICTFLDNTNLVFYKYILEPTGTSYNTHKSISFDPPSIFGNS